MKSLKKGNLQFKKHSEFSVEYQMIMLTNQIIRLLKEAVVQQKYRLSQKKLCIILNLYKLTLRHAIWKMFSRTKNHHLETYLLNCEAISPLFPFFIEN